MIAAYHIIGFSNIELGGYAYRPTPDRKASVESAIAARYEAIRLAGVINARYHQPQAWDAPGRSNWADDLAGDDRYVFLSVGPRYTEQVSEAAYGFVFDAASLISQGAILGVRDLAADYTDIIGEVAEEVAATLPRLPRISDTELDEFMTIMGETDPEMLQFISDNSTNPESELLESLREINADYPGYSRCVALIRDQITELHRETRLTGIAALNYLHSHPADGQMEILVQDCLLLDRAVGYVQSGKEYLK